MKTKSFPVHLLRLWMDPRVSKQKKLLFPLLIVAYWVIPDILPFVPLDDLLFTFLMVWLFAHSAEDDVRKTSYYNPHGGSESQNTIEAEGKVVDEEKEQ